MKIHIANPYTVVISIIILSQISLFCIHVPPSICYQVRYYCDSDMRILRSTFIFPLKVLDTLRTQTFKQSTSPHLGQSIISLLLLWFLLSVKTVFLRIHHHYKSWTPGLHGSQITHVEISQISNYNYTLNHTHTQMMQCSKIKENA